MLFLSFVVFFVLVELEELGFAGGIEVHWVCWNKIWGKRVDRVARSILIPQCYTCQCRGLVGCLTSGTVLSEVVLYFSSLVLI